VVAPFASLTLTQKVLLTTTVGVPLIVPELWSRESPEGSAPAVTENVYGKTPPTADTDPKYGVPTVPLGNVAVSVTAPCAIADATLFVLQTLDCSERWVTFFRLPETRRVLEV
jgi:hypothetical protein